MEEQELKLEVSDPDRFEMVAEAPEILALCEGEEQRLEMAADYLDTPDMCLLRAGYAFRIRREGERWVATLKADLPGESREGLHRHREWEADVPDPTPDLSVFSDPALRHVLGRIVGDRPLSPLFRVEMERRTRELALAGGCRAEWAADRGRIQAAGREETFWEVELELKAGPFEPLAELAYCLEARYPLRPDPRTKFARGLRLAGLALDQGGF